MPTVNALGKICLAVLISISLQAAGDAGWNRGWWDVSSPRNATDSVLDWGFLQERTVHSPGDFTSLLVTPADRSEVCLVVHESTVKGGILIWARGCDVNLEA